MNKVKLPKKAKKDEQYKSKEEVLDTAREFYGLNGKLPQVRDFGLYYPQIYRYYKTMEDLYNAIGLSNKKLSKEELIDCMKHYIKVNEKIPRAVDFDKFYDEGIMRDVRQKFKNFGNLLSAVDTPLKRGNRQVITSKEILLDIIKDFYKENKRLPKLRELGKEHAAVYTYYASLDDAYEEAGFPSLKELTKDQLIDMLKYYQKVSGEKPTITAFIGFYEVNLYTPIINNFGSFRKALIASGITPNKNLPYKMKNLTDDQLELLNMYIYESFKQGYLIGKEMIENNPELANLNEENIIKVFNLPNFGLFKRITEKVLMEYYVKEKR